MKNGIRILFAIFLLVAGFYIDEGLLNNKPPEPTITVEGKKVEVVQGSYCWSGLFNGRCVDKISPPDLVNFHNIQPVVLSPGAKLNIEFKREPKENTLGVNRWLSNAETENIPLKDNVMLAPKEKGVYVHDVYANWEKGSSSYAFVIEVQ